MRLDGTTISFGRIVHCKLSFRRLSINTRYIIPATTLSPLSPFPSHLTLFLSLDPTILIPSTLALFLSIVLLISVRRRFCRGWKRAD